MFKLGAAVGVVNPTAAGTAEDPYVIEGWCIAPATADAESLGSSLAASVGVLIEDTTAHVILRNNIVDASESSRNHITGVRLAGASNVTVVNNTINDSYEGVVLQDASEIELANNSLDRNSREGIGIHGSTDVTLQNNTITYSYYGVILHGSNGAVTLVDNTITNSENGVVLRGSTGGLLVDNTIEKNRNGVVLERASGANLWGNTLGGQGLIIEGNSLEDYQHSIGHSNTVNGEPLVYVRDGSGVEVSGSAGQMILVNTSDAHVSGLDLSHAVRGVQLAYTENTTFVDNTINENRGSGVEVRGSSNVSFIGNTIKENDHHGVHLGGSSGATLADNTIVGNRDSGTHLVASPGATVVNNTITDNWDGVHLWSSDRTTLENNTLMRNFKGVRSESSDAVALAHNSIEDSDETGVSIVGGTRVSIAENDIINGGISVWGSSDVSLTKNNVRVTSFRGVGSPGLSVDEGERVHAEDNYWGAANGPSGRTIDACTGKGADGDGVPIDASNGGEVCFDPWLSSPNPDAGVAG